MSRILFIFSLFLLLVSPSLYAAEPLSVAILSFEGDNVDKDLLTTLGSIVRHEAQQIERYQVVNKFEINFQDVLLVLGCNADSTACLKQAAEQLNAQILIFGKISRNQTVYRLTLNVFDSQSGKMLNKMSRTINVGNEDPVVLFRREVEEFFSKERTASTTRLQIGSNVPEARILIEDTFVGTVPLERKGLPPGRYKIEVNHPDYMNWETIVEIKEGSDINLWAPLKLIEKENAPQTAEVIPAPNQALSSTMPDERVSSVNWGALSTAGAGLVALGGSAVFGYLMTGVEDDISSESDAGTLTLSRYQELTDRGENYELTHRVLLGVGAACVLGGVVWWLLEPGGEATTASIGVSPGGVSGTLTW